MPGGDKAIREPWRMAVSHLLDAGCDSNRFNGVESRQLRTIERMIGRGVNSPFTSSGGRLFDAVAAIAGVRGHVNYEGQAAMQLEWLAASRDDGAYPFELRLNTGAIAQTPGAVLGLNRPLFTIDTRPLIRAVARDALRHSETAAIARRFHSTMVEMIAAACEVIRTHTRLEAVALSGGVFMNALLTRGVCSRLAAAGFRVYRHRLVPPNDGGLCLGQLAIAARRSAAINHATETPDVPWNSRQSG